MYINIHIATERGENTHKTNYLGMSFGYRQTAFAFDADYYFLSTNN